MEDLFSEKKGFKNLNIRQTLAGMHSHKSHNGVQLDGCQRLVSFIRIRNLKFIIIIF